MSSQRLVIAVTLGIVVVALVLGFRGFLEPNKTSQDESTDQLEVLSSDHESNERHTSSQKTEQQPIEDQDPVDSSSELTAVDHWADLRDRWKNADSDGKYALTSELMAREDLSRGEIEQFLLQLALLVDSTTATGELHSLVDPLSTLYSQDVPMAELASRRLTDEDDPRTQYVLATALGISRPATMLSLTMEFMDVAARTQDDFLESTLHQDLLLVGDAETTGIALDYLKEEIKYEIENGDVGRGAGVLRGMFNGLRSVAMSPESRSDAVSFMVSQISQENLPESDYRLLLGEFSRCLQSASREKRVREALSKIAQTGEGRLGEVQRLVQAAVD